MKSQRRKIPGMELAKPKHKPPHRETALFQRPPQPTKAEIAEGSQKFKAVYAAIAAARPARFASSQNRQAWQSAVSEKYALYKERMTLTAQYFSREIISPEIARYDWDFWRDMELLRGGEQSHLEQAVAFLEADPRFFGSGYAKEDIIPAINRLALSSSLAARLEAVVLNMVERRNGRELREGLTRRLDSGDADIRRRARWVLEALAQKDKMEQGKKS